jgi:hypothetical protein
MIYLLSQIFSIGWMSCRTQTQPEHHAGISVDQEAIGLAVPAAASSHQFFFVTLFQVGSQKESFTCPDDDASAILSRIYQKTTISFIFGEKRRFCSPFLLKNETLLLSPTPVC